MGKSSKNSSGSFSRLTPEGEESRIINKAMKLAEKKIDDGTASSQLLTHFLKLATARYSLENEKLKSDLEVAKAKIKEINSREETKVLYEKVLSAMKTYSGFSDQDSDGEYYE